MTDTIIALVGTLVAIVAFVYSAYVERRRRREQLHRQQRFEWTHIQQGVKQICTWLRADRFAPELIIAVEGGGVIVAALAAIEFGDTVPIYVANEPGGPLNGNRLKIDVSGGQLSIPTELLEKKGVRVLICDDFAVSGATLDAIKTRIVSHGLKAKTAALVGVETIKRFSAEPDYVWFISDNSNVYMPWGHADQGVRVGRRKLPLAKS